MRVLLADDDPLFTRLLGRMIGGEHEIVVARDGIQAWEILQKEDRPRIATLDWKMPGMDGLELCRRIRQNPATAATYVVLITATGGVDAIVAGLEAGADDYIVKPFHAAEFHARIKVGERVVSLQGMLSDRVQELEKALDDVKRLRGLLPICSYCKRIRDDRNYWEQLESYLSEHANLVFSHGICPECYERHWHKELESLAPGP